MEGMLKTKTGIWADVWSWNFWHMKQDSRYLTVNFGCIIFPKSANDLMRCSISGVGICRCCIIPLSTSMSREC